MGTFLLCQLRSGGRCQQAPGPRLARGLWSRPWTWAGGAVASTARWLGTPACLRPDVPQWVSRGGPDHEGADRPGVGGSTGDVGGWSGYCCGVGGAAPPLSVGLAIGSGFAARNSTTLAALAHGCQRSGAISTNLYTSARAEPNLSLAVDAARAVPLRARPTDRPQALVDAMRALLRFFTSARLLGMVVALLVVVLAALHWLADLFWFQALGYAAGVLASAPVPARSFRRNHRASCSSTRGAIFASWLATSIFGYRRISRPSATALLSGPTSAIRARLIRTFEVLAPLVAAMIVGFGFAEGWDDLIRFLWAQPFGETEPLYGHDIAFYLFDLPFLDRIQNTVAILAFVATVPLLDRLRPGRARRLSAGSRDRRAALGAPPPSRQRRAVPVRLGVGIRPRSLRAVDRGHGCRVRRRLHRRSRHAAGRCWPPPCSRSASSVLAYAVVAAGQARRLACWPVAIVAAMSLILVVLPISVQRFAVLPNELALEEPYLRRDIEFTRKAFGLAAVEVRAYDPSATLDMAAIEANRDTIDNIRLWDWQPLQQTFRQLQQIRSYYTFQDVDIDRYRLGDSQRQVLLSARELSRDLPGKGITWVNRRLQYTHGYGLVMAPAADKSPDGRPVFHDRRHSARSTAFARRDSAGDLLSAKRTQATGSSTPACPSSTIRAATRMSTPATRATATSSLDSWLKRLVYAWQQFDINILISDYVRADSRIQLWRQIQTRIAKIAPFLALDHDPYLVLDGGRLFWIQDAYTTGERFPYAEPTAGGISYIRNSVKIVVDAYEGDVTFYAVDPQDPVLRVYQAAFPRPVPANPGDAGRAGRPPALSRRICSRSRRRNTPPTT